MDTIQVLSRWIHVVAGVTWIGLLYFFNFVNSAFAPTMDGDTKQKVVPELMPRTLYWFRWGAAWTWVSGVVLLQVVFYDGGLMFGADNDWTGGAYVMLGVTFLGVFIYDLLFNSVKNTQAATIIGFILIVLAVYGFREYGNFEYRAYVIHTGAMFGTIMAFNVWFRIWPAQKQIITAIKEGNAPDPASVALAGLRSKHNTYLSVPLVWAMINEHHAGTPLQSNWWWLPLLTLVGWAVVYLLYQNAAKRVKGF